MSLGGDGGIAPRWTMVAIDCDSGDVERVLRKLEQQVVDFGGWLHENLLIRCENGFLSIHSTSISDTRETLISLPEPCLLPIEDIQWTLSDDELRIKSHPSGLSRERLELIDTMLEIYNLTGKIADHRTSSPWLSFVSDPQILRRLVQGRTGAPKLMELAGYFNTGQIDQLTFNSFLKARTLGYEESDKQNKTSVLMPIIDFMNHHLRCPSFQNKLDEDGTRRISVNKCRPRHGSQECYVHYGPFDAYDTYLLYNFVETAAPFVRSVPLEMESKDIGKIRVHSRLMSSYPKGLPDSIADLRGFMPVVWKQRDGTFAVSHLLIPCGGSPRTLRRVLSVVLKTANPDLKPDLMAGLVREIEMFVFRLNMGYYEDLQRYLAPLPTSEANARALEMARQMVEVQISKLTKNKFF